MSSFARNAAIKIYVRHVRQMAPIAAASSRKSMCNTRVKQLKKCSPLTALFQPVQIIRARASQTNECRIVLCCCGMSHRTFIVGNEYTRYTCSPGGGCRLGLVQLGVLISGYFIPPPFPLRPSLLTTFPLSPILIPEPASLPRPLLHLSFSFPSTSNIPLSPMPLKCTIAPSVGQYEQEAYIANYTVLCHQAWG